MGLEQRIAEHDRQFALAEKKFALHQKRMEKIEKDLSIAAGLVKVGMKMLIDQRKRQKEADELFNYKLNALIDAQQKADERQRLADERQKRSDEKFERLMDILRRRNRNGHSS